MNKIVLLLQLGIFLLLFITPAHTVYAAKDRALFWKIDYQQALFIYLDPLI